MGITAHHVVDDVWLLFSTQSAPGHGVLPVNAFVIAQDPPLLVDTGLAKDRDDLLAAIATVVSSPEELGAVFLTHEDADHAGNLLAVLDAAPRARLITNYVTVSRLLEAGPVPLDRVHVVNPGDPIPSTCGRLTALRPPLYDAPGTLGLHDTATGVVFPVDAFGTYLPEGAIELSDTTEDEVVRGLWNFNRVNHPWSALVDASRFGAAIDTIAAREPTLLLSSHGAVPRHLTALLLDALRQLPELPPLRPPDQSRFERLKPQLG